MSAIAHYCFQKLHMRPNQIADMERNELAFIAASIMLSQAQKHGG